MAKCNELHRLINGPRLAIRSQPGFRKRAMQGRRGTAKASVTLEVYGHLMEGATAKGDRRVTEIVTGGKRAAADTLFCSSCSAHFPRKMRLEASSGTGLISRNAADRAKAVRVNRNPQINR